MRHIGKTMGLLGLGALLVAFNLGGAAGCGDSSTGGGSGGVVEADKTAARLTTALGSISAFAQQSDSSALIARTEQAGLKSQTTECVVTDTEVTCPCEGGGSFTLTLGSGASSDMVFDNCIDIEGNLIDGTMSITSDSSGSATITFHDLISDFGDCGAFTLNGTEEVIDNGDGTSTITIDVTAEIGSDTINIDGNLTAETDDTISGTLDYTGAIDASCNFNHTDTSICPNVADACGLNEADICVGDAYSDVCNDTD